MAKNPWKERKKEFKSQGYDGATAKRFASESAGETEIVMKKGGKLPSYNKKKHRGAIKKK